MSGQASPRSFGAASRFDRWLFAPAPAERLATLRCLVVAFGVIYLLVRSPNLTNFQRFSEAAFNPVGPVSLLEAPLGDEWVMVIFCLTLATGVAALLGFRFRFTAPVYALGLLWVTSYHSSWGMIFHTENLLVIHSLILAVSPAADVWSLDAKRHENLASSQQRLIAWTQRGLYGWPVRAICVATVIAYFLAGQAKLEHAGLQWAFGHELRVHIAYDAVRKIELGSVHSPIAGLLVPYGWFFVPLAGLTMVIELGAPLALLWPRVGRIWCALAWGFHLGVLLLMAIVFLYPLIGVGFASFFEVEKPAKRLLERARRQQWVKRRCPPASSG